MSGHFPQRGESDTSPPCIEALLGTLTLSPRRMTSDAGTRCTSRKVSKLLSSYAIQQYFNQTCDKTTLRILPRDLLGRNCVRLGKLHLVQDLPQVVKIYNTCGQSTFRATPEDVWSNRSVLKPRAVQREWFLVHEGERVIVLIPRGVFFKTAEAQR